MSAIIHRFNETSSQKKQVSKKKTDSLINQIEGCLKETLANLINRMFDSADDILFQLAENADTNEKQNKYFDTMRMLRIERKNIELIFTTQLKAYLLATEHSHQHDNKTTEDELCLIDQDEMEEMVAVETMHLKAINLYSEQLSHLDARIEFLLLKSPDAIDKKALLPKNICESFKFSLADIELSINNKLIIYKLFDQHVISQLESLYKKLNSIFIEQGILPQIKPDYAINKKNKTINHLESATNPLEANALCSENQSHNTNHATPYTGYSQKNNYPQTHANVNIENFINQLINGGYNISGPNIPASFSTIQNNKSSHHIKYYKRQDVLTALSNLQKNANKLPAFSKQINSGMLKRILLSNISRQVGSAITKQVSQADEKTIDFVAMLFSAFTKDNSLPEIITNLLLKLQIPIIKVALLDNLLFSNNNHPCRKTLNLIAYLGREISSKNDSLFAQLNSVVETLLNDFNIDINSFNIATKKLINFKKNEHYKTAEKEKITQLIALQTHARKVVLTELQFHLKNKTLPKFAKTLILKNWSTLMFHRYIKYGKNSDGWRDSIRIINKFIQLLQPIESSYAHNLLQTEKDKVLNKLYNQLTLTKQNPTKIEVEINCISNHFKTILSNSPFYPLKKTKKNSYFTDINKPNTTETSDKALEPILEFEEPLIDPFIEHSEEALDKVSLLPDEVRPGVWFKVHNPKSNTTRRAKLSVIIIEEAKLIFVDRLGVKVIEKDAEIFNDELKKRVSGIIADHSAFDHALTTVINSLSTTG